MTCRRIRRPQRVKMENDPGHQKVVESKSGLKSYWHDSAWPERLRWKTLWCDWAKTQRFKQHLWLKLDCSSSCTEWHKQPFWGPFLFHTRPGRRGSIYKWNHLLKAEYGFYFYLNMTSLLFSVVLVICLFNKALTCHILFGWIKIEMKWWGLPRTDTEVRADPSITFSGRCISASSVSGLPVYRHNKRPIRKSRLQQSYCPKSPGGLIFSTYRYILWK